MIKLTLRLKGNKEYFSYSLLDIDGKKVAGSTSTDSRYNLLTIINMFILQHANHIDKSEVLKQYDFIINHVYGNMLDLEELFNRLGINARVSLVAHKGKYKPNIYEITVYP